MSEISLGLVASQRSWRSEFQAHARDHVGGIKVKILREPRAALEEQLDVIVIDDISTFLTRSKVMSLRERGVSVVGVFDPKEGLGEQFLLDLGADLTLPCTMTPEEMIRAISNLEPETKVRDQFDEMVAELRGEPQPAPAQPKTKGRIIAVGGPAGAGVTEVSIALADVLGGRKEKTLLLDLDEVAPSVGRRLLYRLHPNVLTAMETTAHRTRPLHEVVGKPADGTTSTARFDAVPGIANIEDWVQLREHEVADLLSFSAREWKEIVINTGPQIEDLSGVGLDRFGASRTALASADAVIGVCSPTPVGVLEFLDWMSNYRTFANDNPIWVVVNKVPHGLFGRTEKGFRDLRSMINRFPGGSFHTAEVEEALRENIDERFIAGVLLVPFDDRVTSAMWEGRTVANGPFTKAIAQLGELVAAPVHGRV